MPNLDTIVYTVVALLILFVMFSSIINYYFRGVYTTVGYCQTNGTNVVTCSECNNTVESSDGYGRFKDTCYSLIGHESPDQNDTHCFDCSDWGYRSTARGLFLLIFSMAVVGFALKFLWIKRG